MPKGWGRLRRKNTAEKRHPPHTGLRLRGLVDGAETHCWAACPVSEEERAAGGARKRESRLWCWDRIVCKALIKAL